tara:strand:- start:133 stop:312 length:180 start_codon:yes stop_codon:yes gene_type:complete
MTDAIHSNTHQPTHFQSTLQRIKETLQIHREVQEEAQNKKVENEKIEKSQSTKRVDELV